ncbi:AraC family transcriptional regulator [Propioniciclava coleopterorum]|uniref:AraC family transcriptional regulator n=1 Tax=Propioniciclava coleopterorum TaxID=2714937 RepID=A0A6G7Y3A7_9ACTN|nr:AraC family transcriptional regulator [Propioniciclava coleopterorum]QIK71263.1 AraC family transcriptional regulator [Propioniciclava coleopterorum]
MTTLPRTAADRLARTLQTLRMRRVFSCRAELGEPWALEMPALPDALSFHVVLAGSCALAVPGCDPVALAAGDVALVPHGRGHTLRAGRADAARVDLLPQRYLSAHHSVLRHGGPGARGLLFCGVVGFDDQAAAELVRGLPPLLRVAGATAAESDALHATVRLMTAEAEHPRLGGDTIATRLADVLVVQAIRSWLETRADPPPGWLSGIADPRIGASLEALAADPGADWTLDRLAAAATLSRSAFAARFADLLGEAPGAYVTRWRMRLACARLREEDVTVARLAADLGYRSEAAFHRAFTRVVGSPPGAVRRAAREDLSLRPPGGGAPGPGPATT